MIPASELADMGREAGEALANASLTACPNAWCGVPICTASHRILSLSAHVSRLVAECERLNARLLVIEDAAIREAYKQVADKIMEADRATALESAAPAEGGG